MQKPKQTQDLSKDFDYSKSIMEDEDQGDQEYEKILEKDIEAACDLNVYVNKLEIKDEYTDQELISQKTKEEIVTYKNDQILKLKAYIASLEQEKEDLIDNFKDTTGLLLEKIKDLESNPNLIKNKKDESASSINIINDSLTNKDNNDDFDDNDNNKINDYYSGLPSDFNNIERPQTAVIAQQLNNPKKESTKKQRCPNCQQEIPESEFVAHSLKCLRHTFRCKKCGELINENESSKKKHLEKYRDPKKIFISIKEGNYNDFVMILEHGIKTDNVIEQKEGDYLYHVICRYNRIAFLKEVFERKLKLDINKINKSKETPLVTAINNKAVDCAEILIKKGCDIKLRNKGDLSPLMLCCKFGYTKLFDLLLTKGANINDKNILGETPLSLAQANHHEDLSMKILQRSKLKFNK